ncbi:MAG: 2-oxo acid dehydrogenase subunit E2 [Planctomycetaceae bacterium]
MTIEFKLPAVAEGIESVDIAEILVAVGDTIESNAVICEVETDKSVAEVECPHAGKVTKILVSAGQSVSVGATLIELETAEEATASSPAPKAEPPKQEKQASTEPGPEVKSKSAPTGEAKDVDFKLPVVAEGVDSVDIAEVLVKVGDTIEANAVICEAETDKSVAEIECPHAGEIKAVHISAGQTVKVGEPLVTISTTTAVGGQSSSAAKPAAAAQSSGQAATSTATATRETRAAPQSTQMPVSGPSTNGRPPAPAGPATRRMARKLGVDLYQVQGSANGGRITIEDIEGFVRNRMAQPSGGDGSVRTGVVAAAPLPDFSQFGPITREPLNKLTRTAAANLHAAWITIPHVTQHNLADITELEAARQRYVKDNPKSPKITMTAIMIKAVVGALRAFPKVNSSIDMEAGELILKDYYNIGVAVDTPNGLVVPVIRNCDQKNVLQVASELTEMALKARERKLKAEDMSGASFTITNLGGIGGTYFTPIVNYPEVAILGMSRGQKVLQLEDDQIVERLMLPLSLSYDHRAINGADAARFIVKLSSSLTNFFELF